MIEGQSSVSKIKAWLCKILFHLANLSPNSSVRRTILSRRTEWNGLVGMTEYFFLHVAWADIASERDSH